MNRDELESVVDEAIQALKDKGVDRYLIIACSPEDDSDTKSMQISGQIANDDLSKAISSIFDKSPDIEVLVATTRLQNFYDPIAKAASDLQ